MLIDIYTSDFVYGYIHIYGQHRYLSPRLTPLSVLKITELEDAVKLAVCS